MKSWMKWLGLGAASLIATTATAADHGDGPAASGSPSADIADVYAWAPAATNNLVMIQTVAGDFSENVQYVFHVGRGEAPALLAPPDVWTNVICTFAGAVTSCWAGDQDYVAGDASGPNGVTSAKTTLKVHAGLHADPFYFYLTGFTNTVDTVRNAAPSLMFNAAGCPAVDPMTSSALVGLLNGTNMGPAVNNFAANNVSGLVIELDKDLIDGTGEFFSIWASTHNAN